MLRSLVALPKGRTHSRRSPTSVRFRRPAHRRRSAWIVRSRAPRARPYNGRHDAARYERCARCIRDRQRRRHQSRVPSDRRYGAEPADRQRYARRTTAGSRSGTPPRCRTAPTSCAASQSTRPATVRRVRRAPSRSRTDALDRHVLRIRDLATRSGVDGRRRRNPFGAAVSRRPCRDSTSWRPRLVRTDGFLEQKRSAIDSSASQLPHFPVGFVEDFLLPFEAFAAMWRELQA